MASAARDHPVLFGLIFLLCFSSFSLVLMLGGGPKVSTLEVAIYTSLRFPLICLRRDFICYPVTDILCGYSIPVAL